MNGAKLLVRDRRALEGVLTNLERGQSYLMRPDRLVCMTQKSASTTLHFTNQQGEICLSVDKQIGSELALLHTGIRQLRAFLSAPVENTELEPV